MSSFTERNEHDNMKENC